MKLPNGAHASVPLLRITAYLLNPRHPAGKHKARVFAAALGLSASDANLLRSWLQDLARDGDAQVGVVDGHGQRFVISGVLRYNSREALIRTAWILRSGADAPEFLTAFVE